MKISSDDLYSWQSVDSTTNSLALFTTISIVKITVLRDDIENRQFTMISNKKDDHLVCLLDCTGLSFMR